jgi:hypothetical protein
VIYLQPSHRSAHDEHFVRTVEMQPTRDAVGSGSMARHTERAENDRWLAFLIGVGIATMLLWMIS